MVERLVDQAQEMFAAVRDEGVAAAVFIVGGSVLQGDPRAAEDAGEGRAQLVGHVREERALGAVGGLGGGAGLFVGLLGLAPGGDVHDAALVNGVARGRVDNGADALGNPDRAAVPGGRFRIRSPGRRRAG